MYPSGHGSRLNRMHGRQAGRPPTLSISPQMEEDFQEAFKSVITLGNPPTKM